MDAAQAAGVKIGLGSDWSPTGSKNLLGELKVAWLYSQSSTQRPVQCAGPRGHGHPGCGRILKWDRAWGTIAAGDARRPPRDRRHGGRPLRRADPCEGDGHPAGDDQWRRALRTARADDVARAGRPDGEGGRPVAKTLSEAGDGRPGCRGGPLSTGHQPLRDALLEYRQAGEGSGEAEAGSGEETDLGRAAHPVWSLALDEIQDRGEDLRPRLPFNGPRDFTGPKRAAVKAAASPPLSTILKPIHLDPLTVADDADFLDAIEHQPNVPADVKSGLRALY